MKVCFIYSNRSEFAELEPFIKFFKKKCKIKVVNLSTKIKKIENDENLGEVFKKCYNLLFKENFDYVCILGDRRELPFIALAIFFTNTKIIHIAAGEVINSVTSYDQYFRPVVSLLSNQQICFSNEAKNNVKKLFSGITYLKEKTSVIGNPVFSDIEIEKLINPVKEKFNLVLLHPQSLSRKKTIEDVKKIEEKIMKKRTIIIKGNKDKNSDVIENFYKKIKNEKNIKIIESLPKKKYFQYVKYCDKFFTNTSSVYEIKKINSKCLFIVGERNKGRSHEIYNKKAPEQLFKILNK
jgi:UDP-N-acetylglucosamine 2-epimerase